MLAGVLPLVATLVAWALSTHLGLVTACNPFIDGCVSISRAARHDLPNHVFRALMLPAATLQALVWLVTARWLRQHLGRTPGPRWLAPLGVMAAIALVLYVSFLGTEGAVYRLLRQYGTVVYFGFTCLCMLLAGGAVQKLAAAGVLRLPRLLEVAMLALAAALVLLGLGNAIVAAVFGGALKARIENVTEWWGALIFVAVFVALAAMWARLGLRLTLAARDPAQPAPPHG
ncbi:MAG: hypothetical protein C0505_15670 [Leptothrix sp. (in: Bacteria)]|nr:hypothetical protein [Leptothrix sp. (in: b-proteobacteria)]